MRTRIRLCSYAGLWVLIAVSRVVSAATPYPESTVIEHITWVFSSHDELIPGSDNWPVTWAE